MEFLCPRKLWEAGVVLSHLLTCDASGPSGVTESSHNLGWAHTEFQGQEGRRDVPRYVKLDDDDTIPVEKKVDRFEKIIRGMCR